MGSPVVVKDLHVTAGGQTLVDRLSFSVAPGEVLALILGVSYLFISHDLHTVRAVCDEIIVMQHGRKLDQVTRAQFDRGPHHPYFELLARSVPELRQGWLDEQGAGGGAAVAVG